MKPANRAITNTIVQYVQLVVNVIVGLFSVRLILKALGPDDYGIYDVVGGVIAILSFVKTSLSQTSLRFISVSLGKNDEQDIRTIFNKCFWLHFVIAIVLVVFLEFSGLFLFDFLNIPEDRITASRVVFQCMLISLFLSIALSPFTALIYANEKFYFPSFVGILDSILKLLVAYALLNTSYDKLILYSVLIVLIGVINAFLYLSYVFANYRRYVRISRPSIHGSKDLSVFAAWTMFDIIGAIATRQGYAIMINKLFGTSANAAFAISRQIEGHSYTVSASVIEAIKPQIMKSYGRGDNRRMFRLAMSAGKFGFTMMAIITIPLIIYMPDILNIWLNKVPDGAVGFSRLLVAACMVEQLSKGLVYAAQATGDIKWFYICVCICRIVAIPVSIVCIMSGLPIISVFYVYFVCETLGSLSRVLISSKHDAFHIKDFLYSIMLKTFVPFVIAFSLCWWLNVVITHSLINIILVMVCTSSVYCLLVFLFGLSQEEKVVIKNVYDSFCMKFIKR